jgi:hypothetical protein
VDEELHHADVTEQQHIGMAGEAAGLLLRHPGDPPLAGHGLRLVLPQKRVLPQGIFGEVGREHRVESVQQGLDLGG